VSAATTVVEIDAVALAEAADTDRAAARAARLLAALPPMAVAARSSRLRPTLAEAGCDALLVTKLVNIRWLTGFTGSAALLLVTTDGLLFLTDGRYDTQAHEQLAAAGVEAEIFVGRTGIEQRDRLMEVAAPISRIGLEAEAVSWAAQRRYASDWFPAAELVPTERLVDDLRVVKDGGEIARIEAACAVADAALARIRHRLLEEPVEADFALELDTEMRRLGASAPSFETICGSGPNGAKPHHRPGARRLREGDLVVLDFGALIDGYCSDMTRTVAIGESSPTQVRMLEVVGASQRAGVEAVVAGAPASAVDAATRAVIDDAGWGEAFLHSTGHGVGLEIHEAPSVSKASDATLAAGSIVTVEPGVYLPEHGGVRIEDTVVVTATGCRPLTMAPKASAVA
jgi:Xaa-Pro aminopeptidase